jgi:hypothetical protein
MVATKQRGPRYADAAGELLNIDEVNDRFPREWILLKVARTDERDRVTHGYVLAHTRSRKQVSKGVKRVEQEDPAAHLYIFVGGTRVLSLEEWRTRLAELPDKPYVNAHW